MVMLVNAPVMLGLMAIAEPMISFMITDKWLPSVPFLQWLCIAGLFYPLHSINLTVINVKGRSDIFLKLEIIKKFMVLMAIFAGPPWGVLGLVIAQVINSFLGYFLNAWFSLRLVDYSIREQIDDVYPVVILAGVMAIGVWMLPMAINNLPLAMKLIIQVFAAITFYSAGCIIFRFPAFYQLKMMLKQVYAQKFKAHNNINF
jgi:O-antigen/teichoic acid export membrane protein